MSTASVRWASGPAVVSTVASIVFFGAIFGFFFAWVCSTLWGLDTIDPRAAIEAMNGMNESVRNPVFFTAFFVTPLVAALAAALSAVHGARGPAILLAAAALLYGLGSILFTRTFNLPLNYGLAAGGVPATLDEAARVWGEYSGQWQVYNLIRTVVSGVALTLSACALFLLGRHTGRVENLGGTTMPTMRTAVTPGRAASE